MLAAAAAIHVHDNLAAAKLEAGDLHIIAGIDRGTMRGDGAVQKIGVERLADGKIETFFASGQGLDGLGKFTGNKANQGQLGGFRKWLIRRTRGLRLRLGALRWFSCRWENGNFFIRRKVERRLFGRTKAIDAGDVRICQEQES